jgi:hypothetical protein
MGPQISEDASVKAFHDAIPVPAFEGVRMIGAMCVR